MVLFDITTASEAETEAAGARLADIIGRGDGRFTFIAMYGGLGAGKTAFVRGLCSQLTPRSHVSSPTYSVINVYESEAYIVYHLDLYRINGEDDLYSCGYDEIFAHNNCKNKKRTIAAAEWCEKIPFALSENRIEVIISEAGENARHIKVRVLKKESN